MPLILGTNSIKDTGYDVANSLRFDDGSSDNIQRTYGTPTNAKIFGLSWWVKLGKAFDGSGSQDFWGERADGSNRVFHAINADGTFNYFEKNGGSTVLNLQTNRLFRDNSSWYHFLLLGDSTQGTASNRIKLYVNGVQETSFSTETYPSQDYEFRLAINTTKYFGRIGLGSQLSSNYYDGYLAEAVFVDGTVTAHTDYGEFDEDSPTIWKPKDVSGLTFGNNGFHLDFENASNLGADVSGNGNNFTLNNLTSADQTTDTCTNNFATYNNLLPTKPPTFSEGNTKITQSGNSWDITYSTIGVSSGKWYMEVKWESGSQMNPGFASSSVFELNPSFTRGTNNPSNGGAIYTMYTDGSIYKNNSASSYGSGISSGNIQMLAMDLDNNKFYWGQNGTFQNSADPANNSNGFAIDSSHQGNTWHFHISVYGSGDKLGNFGNPAFSISSGNSDANGFGNFEYAVPSGFFALCTKNLAESG